MLRRQLQIAPRRRAAPLHQHPQKAVGPRARPGQPESHQFPQPSLLESGSRNDQLNGPKRPGLSRHDRDPSQGPRYVTTYQQVEGPPINTRAFSGGPGRTRTCDLRIMSPLL